MTYPAMPASATRQILDGVDRIGSPREQELAS
jgi:hypothetical protein